MTLKKWVAKTLFNLAWDLDFMEVSRIIDKQIFHPYRCELCPKTAEQCVWKHNETIRHVGCATFAAMFEPLRSKGWQL